jgi:hypothetical protein
MKLARQLREAVVRYVPAIEFYGLNGFGWKDDIFEPNPPPNDDFVKRNALVLMEEMKDVEYATESEDNDSGSDDFTSGLVSRQLYEYIRCSLGLSSGHSDRVAHPLFFHHLTELASTNFFKAKAKKKFHSPKPIDY